MDFTSQEAKLNCVTLYISKNLGTIFPSFNSFQTVNTPPSIPVCPTYLLSRATMAMYEAWSHGPCRLYECRKRQYHSNSYSSLKCFLYVGTNHVMLYLHRFWWYLHRL